MFPSGFHFWRNTTKKQPAPPPPRTNVGGLPISVRSEPIIGERVWRVRPTPEGVHLSSLNRSYLWETSNIAVCMPDTPSPWGSVSRPQPHDGPAPDISCACGLYTTVPGASLLEWETLVTGRVHAVGWVSLSGRIIKCTMGYKAEQAEIISHVRLAVSCASNRSCQEPVVVVDLQAAEGRGWCQTHAPGVGAVVEVGAYMRTTIRQLSERYGKEFTHDPEH